ncbi:uncharacterized protein LOC141533074 isoform X1 [Cotesia typhae]|uniref:uncharacterized protein LOC141533074 isoform X1 n=1 Tax=Cotesia typhae TaxID=2053667 RepID=UPI003D69D2FC
MCIFSVGFMNEYSLDDSRTCATPHLSFYSPGVCVCVKHIGCSCVVWCNVWYTPGVQDRLALCGHAATDIRFYTIRTCSYVDATCIQPLAGLLLGTCIGTGGQFPPFYMHLFFSWIGVHSQERRKEGNATSA